MDSETTYSHDNWIVGASVPTINRDPHVHTLKQWFPSASEDYLAQAFEDIQLYAKKNHDYAKGGDRHGNFKRVASILSNYPNLSLSDPVVVNMVYLLKQLDAALWLKSEGHIAQVEGVAERLRDVSIYANIARLIEGGDN